MKNQDSGIGELWITFSRELYAFILSQTGNKHDADDILQDVFLKFHENTGSLRNAEKFRSWIFQITRNQITDYFRMKNKAREHSEMINMQQVNYNRLNENFMNDALRDMIRFMEKLSPEYCEALCLTELEGMSQKDFAVYKNLSYSGAKSRIQRARTMLKDIMMQCCHYHFDKYGTVFNITPAGACCCCEEKKAF